ncbi:hypothetical protein [Pararobbsia alpina]|uniref:hypothetical protein n=1 Tax=Pararobbsia alpina TaxID=621374 RepID=UPI0015822E66|nr:hypothetical protein [Pararobbsia alpina]
MSDEMGTAGLKQLDPAASARRSTPSCGGPDWGNSDTARHHFQRKDENGVLRCPLGIELCSIWPVSEKSQAPSGFQTLQADAPPVDDPII